MAKKAAKARSPRLPDPMPDFSSRVNFPGRKGNPFDVFLHGLEKLETIPGVIFTALLIVIALIPGIFNTSNGFIAFSFMVVDWIILAMLPRRKKSYGPARPPVLMLAFCRLIMALFPPAINLLLQSLTLVLIYYATWIEPHRIHVTRQSLRTHKLPSSMSIRILHLGDLHMEHMTDRESQLLEEISRLKPDLLVFSGDFLNLSYLRDPQAQAEVSSLVKEWKAPLGVFAVRGSPAVDLEDVVPAIFSSDSLHFMDCEVIPIEKSGSILYLAGLPCSHNPYQDGKALSTIPSVPNGAFKILLYHSPDLAPLAASAGYDLQLSGHTHGGQICLPFLGPLFTGSLFGRAFKSGSYQLGQMTLYITRGIGMEGAGAPRARFLCPPEIILWEISGSQDAHEALESK